ncbi:UNVERIFIED_CONTAM: hypothetical protein Slati_1342500 [Sesamum latifolium]|uniref:Uncharacterized protein n=1 Tax=Sesamum latifolium TaxID=2727402 RepID=A0AAW2XKH9_9LAMI
MTADEDIKEKFNLEQFAKLAEREIEHGDLDAVAIMNTLKAKREQMYGHTETSTNSEQPNSLNKGALVVVPLKQQWIPTPFPVS